MAEVLSKIIQYQSITSEIPSLNLHEGVDKHAHQQFMDDMMLMGHPSVQEVRDLKRSVNLFAKDLGIVVNVDKY